MLTMKLKHLLILLLIFFSCNERNSSIKEEYSDKKILNIIKDEYVIELKDSLIHDYPYSSRFLSKDGNFYFVGYNPAYHKLDWFNLTNKVFDFDIKLSSDGPNSVIEPRDFLIHGFDSIYYLGNDAKLSLLNRDGEVQIEYNLNEIGAFEREEYSFGFKAHPITGKLQYDKKNKEIYLSAYSWKFPPFKNEYYDQPFLAVFNLEKERISLLNLDYPDIYKKDGKNLGELFDPNYVFFDDKIIFSFPASQRIFISENNQIVNYEPKSKFNSTTLKYLSEEEYKDIELRMIGLIENPYYYQVIPDSVNKVFYRVHSKGLNYDKGNGKFNRIGDKPVFLQILDFNFKLIDELELEPYTYNALSSFVSEEGVLFVPKTHALNPNFKENSLVFDKFIISYE